MTAARHWPWPDAEDQQICLALMTQFPAEGPGLCSLFGAYRARGVTRASAAELVRHLLPRDQDTSGRGALVVLLHDQGPERHPPTLQGRSVDMESHRRAQRDIPCDICL